MNEGDGIQIPIVTTADTTGAKQQAEAIKGLNDESKRYEETLKRMAVAQEEANRETQKATQSAAALEKTAGRKAQAAEVAKANKDISDGVKVVSKDEVAAALKTTEAVKEVVKWKKEWKEVVHHLGEEFPIAATLGRLFLNGISAATILAAMGIRKLAADIEQLQASLETSEWEKYGNTVAAAKKNFDDAALGASAFARELGRIATEANTATSRVDKLMEVHKAQMSAADKLDEAQKRVETSKVEATEQDPVKKAEKLAEIEERYANKKRKRMDDEALHDLAEQHRKLANEEIAGAALDVQLKKARERKAVLGTEEEVSKKIETERGRLKATDDEIVKKRERLTTLEDMSWARRSTAQEKEKDYLTEQLPELEATRDKQARFVSRLEGAAPGQINQIKAAGEIVTDLEGQRRGTQQRATELRSTIGTQTQVSAIEKSERAQEAALNKQAGGNALFGTLGGTAEGKTLLGAASAADAMQAGKATDQATQEWILQLGRLLTGQNITMKEAVRLIASSNDSLANLKMDVKRLKQQQAKQGSRITNTLNQ